MFSPVSVFPVFVFFSFSYLLLLSCGLFSFYVAYVLPRLSFLSFSSFSCLSLLCLSLFLSFGVPLVCLCVLLVSYVEDFYRQEPTRGATDGPDVEIVGANLQGGASGSAGLGLDHSHRQAQADAEMHGAAANPPPASEEAQIGLITRMFEQKGMKCSRAEAKAIKFFSLEGTAMPLCPGAQ